MGNDSLTTSSGAQGGQRSALRIGDVEKSYPGTHALGGVSLSIEAGEIHALLGGNGSGKSTLIKILAGVERADGGMIEAEGRRHDLGDWTPQDAWASGLRFVHQQPSVFPDLTVAENLAVGHGFEKGRLGKVSWRRQRETAREILYRFEIDVAPTALLAEIGPAQQSMVAIARALQDQDDRRRGILFLDEPTAALPDHEADMLLASLRRYADLGQGIVYVSHRLDEILRIGDRATVLRDGQVAGECSGTTLTHDNLVELIVGHSVARHDAGAREKAKKAGDRLELTGVSSGRVRDVSLCVKAGEIVGIAGLIGSGRSSLLRSVFGVDGRTGAATIDGRALPSGDIGTAMAAGLAMVPEDRASEAAFPDLSIAENLSAGSTDKYWRRLRLDHRQERSDGVDLIGRYGIKAPEPRAPLATLSGGNQQKAIIARWLQRKPKVLLLDEPTQGVDIGARADIHHLIFEAAAAGTSILVVSSDYEEIVQLADRVIVLVDGQIAFELAGEEIDDDRIARLVHAEMEPA